MQLEINQLEALLIRGALSKYQGYAFTYQGGFGADRMQALIDKIKELELED
jgi:hypothetical protein